MRTAIGMFCLGASFFVAGCVSNVAPSDTEPHFVKTDSVAGVSVALTSDGCTASVLFDKAAVSGGAPPQLRWYSEIPLMIGGDDATKSVSVTAGGYYSGTGKAFAEISRLQTQS